MERFPIDKEIIKLFKYNGFWKTIWVFKHYNTDKMRLSNFYLGFKANKGDYRLFHRAENLMIKYNIIRIEENKKGVEEIYLTKTGKDVQIAIELIEKEMKESYLDKFRD
jgi:hypothetical protein